MNPLQINGNNKRRKGLIVSNHDFHSHLLSDAVAVYNSNLQNSNQNINNSQGYVVSHSDFPDDYTANIDSSLTITGLQPEQIVQIKFLLFDLYYNSEYPECVYDYLEIHGSTEGVITYCSNPVYQPPIDEWYNITVGGNTSTIAFRFKTNDNRSTVKEGFYFIYKGKVCF